MKSHEVATVLCGMGCKTRGAAKGCSLRKPSNAADRPQSTVPTGYVLNGRSRRCAPWHRRITTTGVARLAITRLGHNAILVRLHQRLPSVASVIHASCIKVSQQARRLWFATAAIFPAEFGTS